MGEAEKEYTPVKCFLSGTVHELKRAWASTEQPTARLSLVTLRLVPGGAGTPKTEDEAAAAALDPRLSLAEACVTDGCSLLAFVAAAPPGE